MANWTRIYVIFAFGITGLMATGFALMMTYILFTAVDSGGPGGYLLWIITILTSLGYGVFGIVAATILFLSPSIPIYPEAE